MYRNNKKLNRMIILKILKITNSKIYYNINHKRVIINKLIYKLKMIYNSNKINNYNKINNNYNNYSIHHQKSKIMNKYSNKNF